MKRTSARLPLALFSILALGCDVFDESLIPTEEPAPPEGTPELLVGDELSSSLPANLSYRADYHDPIDFSVYSDNAGNLPACLESVDAPGSDIFFRIDMKRGEKWHFHVASAEAQAAADPAVYVLDSTIDRDQACARPLQGINACRAGFPEHFSFIADADQAYYVGVDGVDETNERLKIFAVNAECGNGFREHSEYCDPSAAEPGPVGDCEDCRKVLDDGGDDGATSFNDGPFDATLLRIPDSDRFTFNLSGQINTGCDFDFFRFELDHTAVVTAALDQGACSGIDLAFFEDDNETNPFTLGLEAEDCTEKTKTVSSGTHWVRVAGRPSLGSDQPIYNLELRFERP